LSKKIYFSTKNGTEKLLFKKCKIKINILSVLRKFQPSVGNLQYTRTSANFNFQPRCLLFKPTTPLGHIPENNS